MPRKVWSQGPDETNEYNVQILWSQVQNGKNSTVPVICSCGKERVLQIENLMSSKGKGLCRDCAFRILRSNINSHKWKGGISIISGYRWVRLSTLSPEDYILAKPMVGATGLVKEHRVVMARVMGRSLTREETVHHLNGDRLDNRPENLQIVSNTEHHTIKTKQLHWALAEIERLRSILTESHIPF